MMQIGKSKNVKLELDTDTNLYRRIEYGRHRREDWPVDQIPTVEKIRERISNE